MKTIRIIAVMLLLCLLLPGCKKAEDSQSTQPTAAQPTEPTPYARSGAVLELPGDFFDYSDTPLGEGHSFLYGNDLMGIMGDEYSKTETAADSLEAFAQSQAEMHGVEATQKDGFWTITYEDPNQNEPQIFICAFHETQSSYWIVSAYCPDRMLEDCQADMWKYATNVQF